MSTERVMVAGRYRLIEPVGMGGMGRVWLARDEMLRRDVAIKEVVPPEWLSPTEQEELRDRTLREARTAAQLNHPHVVRIYDVVPTEQWPWIVMEYVASRSLQQVVKQDGPLSPTQTAMIGLAVLDALSAAHRVGVLHRDVKPHNVLVATDGRVVLTDFGLATLETDGAITRGELVMGSPQYIAPERARDAISSQQADLWSLGATLYTAVEGRSPYARSTPTATLIALNTEPPDPIQRAGPLAPVLDGLLRREPRERLAHAEVKRLLEQVASGIDVAPAASAPRPRRALVVTAAALAAVVTASAITAIWLGADRDPAGTSGAPASTGTSRPSSVASSGAEAAPRERHPVRRCDDPPTDARPVPTGITGPPAAGKVPVAPLEGWLWFRDDLARFFIAVPPGWAYYRVGSTVCFVDPLGFRVLGVDASGPPTRDPLRVADIEQRRLVASGQVPGYQQVDLRPHAFAAPGAAWEFSFDGPDGRRHALTHVVTSPARTYLVFWVTAEAEWQPNLSFQQGALATFRPMP